MTFTNGANTSSQRGNLEKWSSSTGWNLLRGSSPTSINWSITFVPRRYPLRLQRCSWRSKFSFNHFASYPHLHRTQSRSLQIQTPRCDELLLFGFLHPNATFVRFLFDQLYETIRHNETFVEKLLSMVCHWNAFKCLFLTVLCCFSVPERFSVINAIYMNNSNFEVLRRKNKNSNNSKYILSTGNTCTSAQLRMGNLSR